MQRMFQAVLRVRGNQVVKWMIKIHILKFSHQSLFRAVHRAPYLRMWLMGGLRQISLGLNFFFNLKVE